MSDTILCGTWSVKRVYCFVNANLKWYNIPNSHSHFMIACCYRAGVFSIVQIQVFDEFDGIIKNRIYVSLQ